MPAASASLSIAVVGAGLIGKRHIEAAAAVRDIAVTAIVDPTDAARDLAASVGAAWFPSIDRILADPVHKPDGVVLATPNHLHVEQGLACIAAGLPTLVEKPISTDVASARRLVEASERAGVPVLVGHHRRHNPLIGAAREAIASGALGRIVAVNAMFWLFKPDDYFDIEWRRLPGAGPVLVNLIHDIDLLRHLVGDIVWVQALASNAVRGNSVEETAAILLRFANGALGTVNVSDTIVAPWSWEMTARENPAYPATGEACYLIGGTHGSLELPAARLWSYEGKRSWWEPIRTSDIGFAEEDPLVRQLRHFARVIRGEEPPLVPAREGMLTLAVVEAVRRSAETGQPVGLTEA